MFDYDVMTESEALQERFQLMKEGEYDAVIDKVEHKVSQNSGNNMFEMTLSVYDQQGKSHQVKDYLVFTKGMMWKVIHCADSAGLLKEYEEKKLAPEVLQGAGVRVRIVIEEGGVIPHDRLKGKTEGSKYPDKNKIDNYIKKADQKPLAKPSADVDEFFSDPIPF
jgi:hypothetical protein